MAYNFHIVHWDVGKTIRSISITRLAENRDEKVKSNFARQTRTVGMGHSGNEMPKCTVDTDIDEIR